MKIENELLRKAAAVTGSFVSATYDFISPIVNRFLRISIKEKIMYSNPASPWMYERAIQKATILKTRKPVLIKDINAKRDVWIKGEYYIEEHDATTLHHDFTIIVNKKCYRMARTASPNAAKKKGYLNIFPGIGEKSGWVRQPEHLYHEVPNPPFSDDGYGAGFCKVLKHGKCYVNITSENNMHVIFEDIDGVYTFIDTAKDNQTIMIRKHHYGKWIGKHKMKESMSPDPYINDDNYAFFVKKDGAAVEWEIVKAGNGRKYLQIHSYRQDMVAQQKFDIETQIEHTYRVKICDKPLPDDIPLASGKGELWCQGKNGRLQVSSIMNSGHYKARSSKYSPHLYIHDMETYEGHNVSHYSFEHKLTLMENLRHDDKRFNIPQHAHSVKGKENLWNKTRKQWRSKSEAVDGVIAWNMKEKNSTPVKIKFTHDKEHWHSATIVGVIPQEGKDADKYAYPIIRNNHGVEFKVAGKGLTQERKADLMNNPDKYIGTEIRYAADDHFESGTAFQPTIKEWNSV